MIKIFPHGFLPTSRGLFLLIFLGVALPLGQAEESVPATVLNARMLNAEMLTRGQQIYLNHCVGCHGEKGEGNGPAADRLNPKPRNFTDGVFKFRSTPTGMMPTDEDLLKTIRQGAIGSAMPAYPFMAERDALSVIQYLKTFSSVWMDPTRFSSPVPIPQMPAWFKEKESLELHVAKGRLAYDQFCVSCHGKLGDGKGTSAATLTDRWDNPILPADLRKPHIRSGRSLTDVYRVLVTGIGGAPMPSYLESTTEEQRWELVALIQQLRTQHLASRSKPQP